MNMKCSVPSKQSRRMRIYSHDFFYAHNKNTGDINQKLTQIVNHWLGEGNRAYERTFHAMLFANNSVLPVFF